MLPPSATVSVVSNKKSCIIKLITFLVTHQAIEINCAINCAFMPETSFDRFLHSKQRSGTPVWRTVPQKHYGDLTSQKQDLAVQEARALQSNGSSVPFRSPLVSTNGVQSPQITVRNSPCGCCNHPARPFRDHKK